MQRILLAGSHTLERVGLRTILKELKPTLSIVEAETLTQVHCIVMDCADIEAVIIDVGLIADGNISFFYELRSARPRISYVFLSGEGDGIDTGVALAMGAEAHINKGMLHDDVAQALAPIVTLEGSEALVRNDPFRLLSSLSPSQLRILKGLQKGLRNKQIAYEMGVTENTVRTYLSEMYRRLGVNSRTQALFLLRDALIAN